MALRQEISANTSQRTTTPQKHTVRVRRSVDVGDTSHRGHMLKQAKIVRETNKRLGLSQEGKAPFFH